MKGYDVESKEGGLDVEGDRSRPYCSRRGARTRRFRRAGRSDERAARPDVREQEARPGALQQRQRVVRREGARLIEEGAPRAYGRRTFLAVAGAGLSSLLWAKPVWRAVSGAARPLERALPAGLVPSSGWRIYTVAASMPRFDPTMWRLRIEGLVDSPLALTYDKLRRLPRAEQVSGFHCVT